MSASARRHDPGFFAADRRRSRELRERVPGDVAALVLMLAVEADAEGVYRIGNRQEVAADLNMPWKALRSRLEVAERAGVIRWVRARNQHEDGAIAVLVDLERRRTDRGSAPATGPVENPSARPDRGRAEPVPGPVPGPVVGPVGGPIGAEQPGETAPTVNREQRTLRQPPTDTHQSSPEGAADDEDEDPRFEAVVHVIARTRTERANPRNPDAYRRSVETSTRTDDGPEIRRLLWRYPEAKADQIAGAIDGEGHSLRYLTPRHERPA